MDTLSQFITLDLFEVFGLFVVGFVGGMVSGFIGSGGAFVLTPAMMTMGAPGIVAVASNMCHKFPKALVGAMKRARYGQVDVKLGIIIGVSAEVGVLYGAHLQESIKTAFGNAGSNLYVSAVFVVVLAVVGSYVLLDAFKIYRSGTIDEEEKPSRLALWIRSINIPGTMVYFKSIDAKVSVLITIPMGLATGLLAATIAVGGFIGVPSMIYLLGVPSMMATATELVIAFIMGLGGTVKYGLGNFVDIRLAMIILAGSLFGIQIGAIGTTYVKPHVVKVVMGVIMVLVLFSRLIVIPVYLGELEIMAPLSTRTVSFLKDLSFWILVLALVAGAGIIFRALLKGMMAARTQVVAHAAAAEPIPLRPGQDYRKILLATDGSEYSIGAVRHAIGVARRNQATLRAVTMVFANPEDATFSPGAVHEAERKAKNIVEAVQKTAVENGVDCDFVVRVGNEPSDAIVAAAEEFGADLIVLARRGKRGLARMMVGEATHQVIGKAKCVVMVVPRLA